MKVMWSFVTHLYVVSFDKQATSRLYIIACMCNDVKGGWVGDGEAGADLANDGGPGCTPPTPPKVHDEQSIQQNIDSVADESCPQGRFGVTQATEDTLYCS